MVIDIFIMLGVLVVAMMSPGPDMMLVMRYALKSDFAPAFYCSLGICAGLVFHVLFAVFGLTALMAASPVLYMSAKLLGAAYLIWMGWKIASLDPRLEDAGTAHRSSRKDAFRKGFFTNILNPKVMIFMLALFSQVIDPAYDFWQKSIFIAILFPAVLSVWCMFTFLIRRPFLLKALQKHQRRLNIIFGIMLFIFGSLLAVSP